MLLPCATTMYAWSYIEKRLMTSDFSYKIKGYLIICKTLMGHITLVDIINITLWRSVTRRINLWMSDILEICKVYAPSQWETFLTVYRHLSLAGHIWRCLLNVGYFVSVSMWWLLRYISDSINKVFVDAYGLELIMIQTDFRKMGDWI